MVQALRIQKLILSCALMCCAIPLPAQHATQRMRRQQISSVLKTHRHSILLVHAKTDIDEPQDGFRQDPFFYYFSGIENLAGAILAIDCDTAESWLFLPTTPPFANFGLRPEVEPGADAEVKLGIDHVADWSTMRDFLSSRSSIPGTLYYADGFRVDLQLPGNLLDDTVAQTPLWVQVIHHDWPAFKPENASPQVFKILAVQGPDEITASRNAATATVAAFEAGLRTIAPGVSQRKVESAVDSACWNAGAHGSSFWAWALAGKEAVFPTPFSSSLRYDHLDQTMQAGDLARLDVGCEVRHYGGDLGRTVPVSGHFNAEQRETWDIYVAAYNAGAAKLRTGVSPDQVFETWRAEIVSHRKSARSDLARHAIELWSERKNVPLWQIHTMTIMAGPTPDVLPEGATVDFEPNASVDGQGFFMENMYLITNGGAELLTPGVPTTAYEIEAAMAGQKPPARRRPAPPPPHPSSASL